MRRWEFLCRERNYRPGKSTDCWRSLHSRSLLSWLQTPFLSGCFQVWDPYGSLLSRSLRWMPELLAWRFSRFTIQTCFSFSCNNWRGRLTRSTPWQFGAIHLISRIRISKFWSNWDVQISSLFRSISKLVRSKTGLHVFSLAHSSSTWHPWLNIQIQNCLTRFGRLFCT